MMALALCKQAEGQVVNIGSGKEWSIAQTVEMLCQIIGRNVDITIEKERIRPPKSEVSRLLADTNKLKQLTGWESQIPFSEGLLRTVEWIKLNPVYFDADCYAR
jgi:nucleoside-diphosphate-sugar epimerase